MDFDGIVRVSAEEETTGSKNGITITNEKGRLSSEEIMRMIEEAEMYKDEVKRYRKVIKAKNTLDDFVYKMEKAMKNWNIDSRISLLEMQRIRAAIREAKNLLDGNQQAEEFVFENCLNKLQNICKPILINMIRGCSDEESDMDDY